MMRVVFIILTLSVYSGRDKTPHRAEMSAAAAAADLAAAALREFSADTPTTQTVMRVAVSLAATVNRLPGLRGREKAELVLGALREAINRLPMAQEVRAPLLATVDTVVPEMLNLVVAAGRGELDFRRPSVGCLAAIARGLCRTAAAVAATQGAQGARVAEIASGAAASLETAVATAAGVVAELPSEPTPVPANDSSAPPTAPPTDEPSSS
jgi:hypothetical protein